MKLCTFNVNSLKARGEFVGQFLDAVQPDILGIQELKLEESAVPVDLFESRGYHVAIHAQKQWNGVLVASKSPIEVLSAGLGEAEEGQARAIAVKTADIQFINLYCPQGQRVDSDKFPYKLRFFDRLIEWVPEVCDLSGPVALVGDINIAPEQDDIYDPEKFAGIPSFHPEEHARFEKLLALGFTDVVKPHLKPKTYSFWDYRGGAFRFNKGMRIDHILCTESLAARVTGGHVEREWRKVKPAADGTKLKPSDHAPVIATVE